MSAIDLTIGIPTYNRAGYIRDAVASALNQKKCKVEVIVCDNASTDNTEEVLKSYFKVPDFIYIKNKFNLGPVANYNKCLENARGNYFMLIGDDDWLADNYGQVLLETLSGKDDVFIGKCIVVNPQGEAIKESSSEAYSLPGEEFIKMFIAEDKKLQRHTWFMLCARTDTWRQHQGFPATCMAQHSENLLLMEMGLGRRVVYNPVAICYYRVHPQSYGNSNVFSVAVATMQYYDFWQQKIEPELKKRNFSKISVLLLRIKLIVQLTLLYLYRVVKYGPRKLSTRLYLILRYPYKSWIFMAIIIKLWCKLFCSRDRKEN